MSQGAIQRLTQNTTLPDLNLSFPNQFTGQPVLLVKPPLNQFHVKFNIKVLLILSKQAPLDKNVNLKLPGKFAFCHSLPCVCMATQTIH